MNWQVTYALEYLREPRGSLAAEYVRGDTIKISAPDRPDVLAVISAAESISQSIAIQYHHDEPEIDFLCGYKKSCIWEGDAISYLVDNEIGWGSFGTLTTAASEGNANTASHKVFAFSDRLIRQYGPVILALREFDRVYRIALKNGRSFRLGMIEEYEPTADAVRSFWDKLGPVDVIWNINPSGNLTQAATEVGRELGCEVVKWEELKAYIKKI